MMMTMFTMKSFLKLTKNDQTVIDNAFKWIRRLAGHKNIEIVEVFPFSADEEIIEKYNSDKINQLGDRLISEARQCDQVIGFGKLEYLEVPLLVHKAPITLIPLSSDCNDFRNIYSLFIQEHPFMTILSTDCLVSAIYHVLSNISGIGEDERREVPDLEQYAQEEIQE